MAGSLIAGIGAILAAVLVRDLTPREMSGVADASLGAAHLGPTGAASG